MKRLLALFLTFATFALWGCNDETTTNRVYVFSQPGCGHCINAHDYMSRYYKDYDIKEINVREGSNMDYMLRYARRFKVPTHSLGTPFIVLGDNYIMGWGEEQIKQFNKQMKEFKPKVDK